MSQSFHAAARKVAKGEARSDTKWRSKPATTSEGRSPQRHQQHQSISPVAKLIGDPSLSLDEPLYPVDFKPVFFKTRNRISENDAKIIVKSYETGMSFRDISMQFGWTTSQIRRELQRSGIKPRERQNLATGVRALKPGKQGSLPYFGFCNFEGRIVKDPREFPILQVIHRHWSRGKTIHQINLELNKAKILSRTGKQWSWAALQNIVVRFEAKKIILSNGGKYELR